MNTASEAKTAAQTAYDNAKDHYDDNIGDLQDALEAAIAGRQDYDDEVEAKRAAYDTVNDGVELAYETEEVVADYDKDGPISELYLSAGQSVAISVESGKYYYIGLKSLNGNPVTAVLNGSKTVTLSHTTDLYYEVTNGSTITIKNNSAKESNAILAITKLRATGAGNTTSGAKAVPTEQLFSAFKAMSALAATPYTGDILTEEEATAPIPAEEPVVEEPVAEEPVVETEPAAEEPAAEPITEEPAAEPEVTVVELTETDIVIENPEPEEEPAAEPEPEAPAAAPVPAPAPSTNSRLASVLKSFFGFFRR